MTNVLQTLIYTFLFHTSIQFSVSSISCSYFKKCWVLEDMLQGSKITSLLTSQSNIVLQQDWLKESVELSAQQNQHIFPVKLLPGLETMIFRRHNYPSLCKTGQHLNSLISQKIFLYKICRSLLATCDPSPMVLYFSKFAYGWQHWVPSARQLEKSPFY